MSEKKSDSLRTVHILLAGGAGRRLWPSSRAFFPKPLLRPGFEKSLLENAVSLVSSFEPSPDITVLAGAAQEKAFRSHIDGIETAGARVSLALEPLARNTAPAIALGCMRALDLAGDGEDAENADKDGEGGEEDVIVAVLPSDHFVDGKKEFKRALSAAVSAAREGFISVIGVRPTRPETGYGYINAGNGLPPAAGKKGEVFAVNRFTEKPDKKTAARYVKDGFLWNCGIFVFRASVMLGEIKKHAPKVFSAVRGAFAKTGGSGMPDAIRYAKSPDISIDYAVMEKTDLGAVVPASFSWSDIGSWRAVYEILPKDKGGNAAKGDAVVENSENCLILSGGGRLVAASGLKNLAIVDEADAVLVADMNDAAGVKAISGKLAAGKRREAHLPAQREQKWGDEAEIKSGEGFSVRILSVKEKADYNPSASAGHILVLEGAAVATLGGKGVDLSAGDMLEIPDGVPLRVKNGGGSVLRLLEVSFKRDA